MAKQKKAKRSASELSLKTAPENRVLHILMPYILAIVAIFLFLCFILGKENMGFLGYVSVFLKGLFSYGAYAVPLFLAVHAFFYKRDLAAGSNLYKFWFSFGNTVFLGALSALIENAPVKFDLAGLYASGKNLSGGGVLGGTVYFALEKSVGFFTPVLVGLAILVFTAFLFGTTPADLIRSLYERITARWQEGKAEREERQEIAREEKEAARLRLAEERAREKYKIREETEQSGGFFRRRKCKANLESGDPVLETPPEDKIADEDVQIRLPAEEVVPPEPVVREFTPIEEIETVPPPTLDEEIHQIFDEDGTENEFVEPEENEEAREKLKQTLAGMPAEFSATKETISAVTQPETPPEYRFPPLSLLQMAPPPSAQSGAEQQAVARKLVDTLASFGVKTSVVGISKGPTVTRYELQPQPGVRVRAIVNLTDDIALALAASGVRIEAPIPGKEAVGIEVPNKAVETVYVRSLIDSEAFREAKSKLFCCLGMDVAGKPIFCDLAKMPHILIAGATGMGKSVCLNSLIVSILYHARPEEVQMILIDPKKVEMAVYNRIPHLLVPVVSDPKKAAGALNWAVIEMEKRFIEMEEVGVRDIKTYNEITKNDPEKQPMSQIVIFIDELADLMMTARDEVETSICRIAQKARAAGMHLVIGTQRPSVDVITGLIKANVPSRIAFTVASQVDSRTIIDIIGAEKLIGRGDMLYAPVGATKPMRVQGSFVSEKEIETVCDFIRAEREAEYDEAVSNLIEREASKCGEKKKTAMALGAEGEGEGGIGLFADKDPLLERAIEVAITEKKVSTSLLQRKLSVGYARAAKLIDFMAEMHVVGEYAGSKPRDVLWTSEYWAEYKMRSVDDMPIQ